MIWMFQYNSDMSKGVPYNAEVEILTFGGREILL